MKKKIKNQKKEKKPFLSDVKIEQLNKQPIVESSVNLSEDKKWLIHKTTITDIKAVPYYSQVLGRAS